MLYTMPTTYCPMPSSSISVSITMSMPTEFRIINKVPPRLMNDLDSCLAMDLRWLEAQLTWLELLWQLQDRRFSQRWSLLTHWLTENILQPRLHFPWLNKLKLNQQQLVHHEVWKSKCISCYSWMLVMISHKLYLITIFTLLNLLL